jgi:hypothetical protein
LNITGVIDWTATYASPWEGFLTPPIEFRLPEFNAEMELFFEIFEKAANATEPKLPISNFMSSKAGRIIVLVNNYHFGHPPMMPESRRTELMELMFGNDVTWIDIKQMCQDHLVNCARLNVNSTVIPNRWYPGKYKVILD